MSFETAVSEIMGIETDQFTDEHSRPADKGGPTRWGIIQRTYDRCRDKWHQPRQSVRYITADEAVRVYREEFWLAGKCHELPEPLATVHFDGMVQHQPDDAIRCLQRALGVVDDGRIGPVTLKAAHDLDPCRTAEDLLWERAKLYGGIVAVEANHDGQATQADNINGWIWRLCRIRRAVAL